METRGWWKERMATLTVIPVNFPREERKWKYLGKISWLKVLWSEWRLDTFTICHHDCFSNGSFRRRLSPITRCRYHPPPCSFHSSPKVISLRKSAHEAKNFLTVRAREQLSDPILLWSAWRLDTFTILFFKWLFQKTPFSFNQMQIPP